MTESYSKLICWYLYKYHLTVIESLQRQKIPFMFIEWGEGPPSHHILKNICKENSIPIWFMELGAITGTISIEPQGQCGKSVIALHPFRYRHRKVTNIDINETKKIIDYMKKERMNRNVQTNTDNVINEIKSKINPNYPTIVYYLMDDYESCIIPSTLESKKYRSPIFNNSIEAALYLDELAGKNQWNLIVKPHPILIKVQNVLRDKLNNALWVENADVNALIDVSDLTVTIFSQICFDSLIRGKPVVMLGYNQTKKQKCTYQCSNLEKIEKTINYAVSCGFSEKQKNAFEKLFTKMRSDYFLYDDLSQRGIRWGKSVSDCKEMLLEPLLRKK